MDDKKVYLKNVTVSCLVSATNNASVSFFWEKRDSVF